MSDTFRLRYQHLEDRMRNLAEEDGDAFLPNLAPLAPVDYVLIGMEPSLGRWANNVREARLRVGQGFRNFISSFEDFLLHFSVRTYLCGPSDAYHITDVSKGAMLVKAAAVRRAERYLRWHPLLLEELALVAKPGARIIAIGSAVFAHLQHDDLGHPLTKIIHYSGLAGRARREAIKDQKSRFEVFRESVSVQDILATAEHVLAASPVSAASRDSTLARLAKAGLTESRKELLFSYKVHFETLRAGNE